MLALLVRVDGRPVVGPPGERLQAGGRHAPQRLQLAGALGVHRAPDAALLARREADRVAVAVDRPPYAVDPAEAQRLVDRLRPRHARAPGRLLVEADQQLALRGVMALEPGPELGRCREE